MLRLVLLLALTGAVVLGVNIPLPMPALAQFASPVIRFITPAAAQPGGSVTIYGQNYTPHNNIVNFQSSAHSFAVLVHSLTGNILTFPLPPNAVPGFYTLTITTNGQSSNPFPLQIGVSASLPVPAPTPFPSPGPTQSPFPSPPPLPLPTNSPVPTAPLVIAHILPQPALVGSRIQIYGRGFARLNNQVQIVGPGGTASFNTYSYDSVSLGTIFLPPNLPPGTYQITVATNGQISNTFPLIIIDPTLPPPTSPLPSTPPPSFSPQPSPTVSPPPAADLVLSAITPNPATSGNFVKIHGQGFTSMNNRVVIANTSARAEFLLQSLDGRQLSFFLNIGQSLPAGTYQVTVITNNRTSNALPFTIVPNTDCFLLLFCRPTDATYVALGDSLAVGLVSFQGYVYRYENALEAKTQLVIDTDNFGRSGWESGDLLAALQTDESFRQAIASADYITWNIGGNDLRAARQQYQLRTCGGNDNQECLRHKTQQLKQHWTAIMDIILQLRKNAGTDIRTMDLYYPYVGEDRARDTWPNDGGTDDYDEFKPYLADVNGHIARTTSSLGIPMAQVARLFNGPDLERDPEEVGYISVDDFHPNDTGHRVIADLLIQVKPLATPAALP